MSRRWWGLGAMGVGLALVGAWGAWVPHRAAALVLSGWDLGEYLKLVPGAAVPYDLFYLPVWCGGVALALLSGGLTGRRAARWAWVAVALALMAAILPPYLNGLRGYLEAEWRGRLALSVSGLVLVGLGGCRRWPNRLVGGALAGLTLAGALPARWGAVRVVSGA